MCNTPTPCVPIVRLIYKLLYGFQYWVCSCTDEIAIIRPGRSYAVIRNIVIFRLCLVFYC